MRGATTTMQRTLGRSLAAAFVCVLFAAGCVTPEPMMLVEPSPGAMGVEDEVGLEPTVGMGSMESPAEASVTMEDHDRLQAAVALLQVDVAELQITQNEIEDNVNAVTGRVGDVETGVTAVSEEVMARLGDIDTTLQGMKDGMALGPAVMLEGRDVEAEVALAVDVWREAWEKGDVAAYMAVYDEDAIITRINISDGGVGSETDLAPSDLRAHVERLSGQYDRTDVAVRGFRVVKEGSEMAATFEQEYSAFARPGDLQPIYADRGVKTLLFAETDGRWLIVEEKWAPLRR